MQFSAGLCMRAIVSAAVVMPIYLSLSNDSFAQASPADSVSKKEQREDDQQLAKDVRLALSKNKINTNDILILARRGVVSLNGYVPDPSQIQAAAMVAQSVPGVTTVKSYLLLYVNGE